MEDRMPDVVDKIEHDHREVEQLFSEFDASRDRSLARKICDELDKHSRAEEAEVYPVIAGEVSDGKHLADEAEGEHKEARQLIGRIRQTKDADHLGELMGELEKAIQHHVKEEESEMLPKAREELPAQELEQLGVKFEEAKQATG
jgi:hemerythrin superfamily protein